MRFQSRVSAMAFLKARLAAARRRVPETDSAIVLFAACLELEPAWRRFESFFRALDEAAELIGYPGDITTISLARTQLAACAKFRRDARRRLGISD